MSNIFTTLLTTIAVVASPFPTPSASPSHGHVTTVHMRDFAFVPKTVTLAAGTTLTIVNDDSEAHTASALDKSFDSAGLDTNESWSHVFKKPGTYPYICELHPYMKGVIIVRPAHLKGSS